MIHPFVILKKRRIVKRVRVKNDKEMLKNVYRGSIVFAHYIRGIKKYSDL